MITLDTNVLVRYFVADDPAQSRAAAALIERAALKGERFFVPHIVLCELVWAVSYAYAFERKEIAALLADLRRAAQVEMEAPDEVGRALERYSATRGDFADFLIAERAIAHGCSAVATFDRALHSDRRFVRVG